MSKPQTAEFLFALVLPVFIYSNSPTYSS